MQLVRVQHAIREALDGCRKLNVVTRGKTLFVLTCVVLPCEDSLVVESWPFGDPVGVRERAQAVLTAFTHRLERLPHIEMIPMPGAPPSVCEGGSCG